MKDESAQSVAANKLAKLLCYACKLLNASLYISLCTVIEYPLCSSLRCLLII